MKDFFDRSTWILIGFALVIGLETVFCSLPWCLKGNSCHPRGFLAPVQVSCKPQSIECIGLTYESFYFDFRFLPFLER